MNSFVLGSLPLISITQKCYEYTASGLIMARELSTNLSEIDAMTKEIKVIMALAEQCEAIIKEMEG
jgi:uncharacterized membrane protein YdfJ with MMPL/SSD domain